MSKKKTTEEFIEEAIKIHGDKYDYSKVEYTNNKTKVCIICSEHGEFWQIPNTHLKGGGCKKCGRIVVAEKLSGEKEFFKKAKEKYGDKFDYSNVNYVNTFTNVEIICKKHGKFLISPHEHLRGNGGCLECKKEKVGNFFRNTREKFIEKARKVHGDKYDYSEVVYKKAHERVCIICPKHGVFEQIANCHLNGEGCPKCKVSKLEKDIMDFLSEKGINFRYDVRDFKWLNGLTLDFYLPDYNIAIECQGIQHFEASKNKKSFFNEEKVNEIKSNDYIKKSYARKMVLNYCIIAI